MLDPPRPALITQRLLSCSRNSHQGLRLKWPCSLCAINVNCPVCLLLCFMTLILDLSLAPERHIITSAEHPKAAQAKSTKLRIFSKLRHIRHFMPCDNGKLCQRMYLMQCSKTVPFHATHKMRFY